MNGTCQNSSLRVDGPERVNLPPIFFCLAPMSKMQPCRALPQGCAEIEEEKSKFLQEIKIRKFSI